MRDGHVFDVVAVQKFLQLLHWHGSPTTGILLLLFADGNGELLSPVNRPQRDAGDVRFLALIGDAAQVPRAEGCTLIFDASTPNRRYRARSRRPRTQRRQSGLVSGT